MHKAVNHKYGTKEYSYHLSEVNRYAKLFINFIPKEDQDTVLAATWLHDAIEDAMQTYNDVKNVCGKEVADLAYALTNEKGRNRAERASAKYYKEMRDCKYATFIKICDRLANVYNGRQEAKNGRKNSMLKKYASEHSKFKLSIAEIKRESLKDKFVDWVFAHSSVRLMYPNLFNRFANIKYYDMWDHLEFLYLEND